jgi:dihydroorotase
MKILIKNGRVIDPSQGLDGVVIDLLIESRKIKKIYKRSARLSLGPKDKTIDAKDLYVLPGLVDMHAHLREPGFEHKETIASGTRAAVRGGFTSLCAMPNTSPVNDNAGITEYILQKANKEGVCWVFPIGAITKGQLGEELAEMGLMNEGGCVAFSDDGMPVKNSALLRRALEYSKTFNVPIISHCEDTDLVADGVMNEGLLSYSLGLSGIPAAAEETIIFRDVSLAELTGARLHVAHVSTEGSVRIIRDAKARGIKVTAETCPHYFSITEDAVKDFDTNARVNPPLRTKKDVKAIKKGLSDGTIDVIATDHAPHHKNEKQREFDIAPSGISGLETALSLSLKLVEDNVITLSDLVRKMALNPAQILGIDKGTLMPGSAGDLTIVDLKSEYQVNAEQFVSKGKNSPFDGWKLKGRPVVTICKGRVFEWR